MYRYALYIGPMKLFLSIPPSVFQNKFGWNSSSQYILMKRCNIINEHTLHEYSCNYIGVKEWIFTFHRKYEWIMPAVVYKKGRTIFQLILWRCQHFVLLVEASIPKSLWSYIDIVLTLFTIHHVCWYNMVTIWLCY